MARQLKRGVITIQITDSGVGAVEGTYVIEESTDTSMVDSDILTVDLSSETKTAIRNQFISDLQAASKLPE